MSTLGPCTNASLFNLDANTTVPLIDETEAFCCGSIKVLARLRMHDDDDDDDDDNARTSIPRVEYDVIFAVVLVFFGLWHNMYFVH